MRAFVVPNQEPIALDLYDALSVSPAQHDQPRSGPLGPTGFLCTGLRPWPRSIGAAGAVNPGFFGCAGPQTDAGHNSEIAEREVWWGSSG